MQRLGAILIAFGFSVLVYEALRVGAAWWSGDIDSLGIEEILVLAALPVLGFVAWWHLRQRRADRPSPPGLRNPGSDDQWNLRHLRGRNHRTEQ
jgi:hypothetical protein